MSTKFPAEAKSSLPDISQQAVDGLFALVGAMRAEMRNAMREGKNVPEGLAPMHLRMLKHCHQHPGTSQQALVQASGRDKGQIARLVKELEAQGLLLREADPADGRSQRLNLSAAGRAAYQRFRKQEAAIAQRLFDDMSADEIQALIDRLHALRSRLGSHAGHQPAEEG